MLHLIFVIKKGSYVDVRICGTCILFASNNYTAIILIYFFVPNNFFFFLFKIKKRYFQISSTFRSIFIGPSTVASG